MTAIFFDIDDTLYDQLIPFRQAFEKHFHFPQLSVARLYRESRRLSDQVFVLSETGQLTLQEMHIYRIKHALENFGYSISDEQALAFQKSYAQFQKEISLSATMTDLLSWCQQENWILGIISNGPKEHQRAKMDRLKLQRWFMPENIYISSEVGWSKPDSRLFHLAQSSLKKEEVCFYVGDSFANDVIGAKKAGWQAIWLNRRHYAQPYSHFSADFQADSEQDLWQILLKLNA